MISIFLSLLLGSQLVGQNITEKIDAILQAEISPNIGPGITAVIVKDGKLFHTCNKGYANLAYEIPFTDSTAFELASVTKQFTAACIGVLEQRGDLNLNEDIRKYIPELYFSGDTIRVRHLLNHTSGIRNHNVLLDLMGFDYQHCGYSNRSIEELMFRQQGFNNKPGDRMLYSNTNYVMLALLVKRISGMEIHEFAKKELFEPLGMYDTFFKSDLHQVIKNRAANYYLAKETYKEPKSLTLCVGAGGMLSTVKDLSKWMIFLMDKGHPDAYISTFITKVDTLNNGSLMSNARGVFLSPYKNYRTVNHSGRDWGLRSQMIVLPELSLGLFVFTNSEHINVVESSYKIIDLFIQGAEEMNEPMAVSSQVMEDVSQYIGDYQELNSDLRMHISSRRDTLFAQSGLGKIQVPLASYAKGEFHRFDNPSVKYMFNPMNVEDADLLIDFGGAMFYFESVDLVENSNENLKEFEGRYYSEELSVAYELSEIENKLILNYPNNEGLVLTEGQEDVFGSNRRTRYSFKRDQDHQVVSFTVASEGTVKNILFERVE